MFSIKYARFHGERNNKPNFVALGSPPSKLGKGSVYKSRIVNPPKKRARGPLLRVDPDARVTRYFCMAEGKGIAPGTGTTLHRGQPEKKIKGRSRGHREMGRRAMGDMTDFDKILPQTDEKVNGKCPIKRTERRSHDNTT